MAIYKVVLNGAFQGKDIKNILYYRNGVGIDICGLTVGGTVELSAAVRAMVWPALSLVLPDSYELQDITTYVYNQETFALLYQNPTTEGVQEPGLVSGVTFNGPAPCAIVRMALEPTLFLLNGPKPPKRGYLAIGPLSDGWIKDNGEVLLDTGHKASWDVVCAALANNVETILPIPAVFFPIRVHQDKILNLWKITSFADVRDATVRTFSSYRRSRMPEN